LPNNENRDRFVAMRDALVSTLQPRHGTAWHGGPTSVGALRGVTAAQARWVPGRGRHSIWELTLHIAYWDYAVRRHLEPDVPRFARSPANWPALPERPDERAWARDRALLADEHARLVRAVGRFSDRRWNRVPPEGRRWRYGEMIVGALAHEVYHTGQIQLLKRLWRTRR
jgi:DinB superfamily